MMSPSEAAFDMNPAVQTKLLKESWGSSSVLPLEFKAVDHPLRRKTDWALDNEGSSESEFDLEVARLREQTGLLEQRLILQSQQSAAQITEARRQGRIEGHQQAEVELTARVDKERECIAKTCKDFAKDRTRYFAAVEGEVVRLALAIAERVLHREAKLDPLLLGAAVRVALEKLAEESVAVLHVPAGEVEAWRAMLSAESHANVQVVGDERLEEADCVLDTNVGRVELGVCVQLAEIEKGFFDLMQLRPN